MKVRNSFSSLFSLLEVVIQKCIDCINQPKNFALNTLGNFTQNLMTYEKQYRKTMAYAAGYSTICLIQILD